MKYRSVISVNRRQFQAGHKQLLLMLRNCLSCDDCVIFSTQKETEDIFVVTFSDCSDLQLEEHELHCWC